jgi:hypothetical protein
MGGWAKAARKEQPIAQFVDLPDSSKRPAGLPLDNPACPRLDHRIGQLLLRYGGKLASLAELERRF